MIKHYKKYDLLYFRR